MNDEGTSAAANYRIEAVDCAIDVLIAVASTPDLGAAEIARKVGGSRQRIFRMLKSLEARGMIGRGRDGRSYRLGYQSLLLGNAAHAQIDLVRVAEPVMRDVGLAAEETVQLRICEAFEAVCVSIWEPDRDLRVHAMLGRRRLLHAGSRKIFLAFMPEEQREQFLARPLPRYTARTVTDPDVLRRLIDDIRVKGFLISRGEVSEDIIAVAAPIFAADKSVLASINIAAPAARTQDSQVDQWVSMIVEAAIKISRQIGYPAHAGGR